MKDKNLKKNTDIESLLSEAGHIRTGLSSDEKAILKARIYRAHDAYIDVAPKQSGVSPYHFYIKPLIGIALLLLVIIPGGFAAQGSLPGDPLYTFKTDLIEKMPLLTKRTPESRAEYYSSLTETRLKESAELLRANRVTPESEAALTEALSENVTGVLVNVESNPKSGSEEVILTMSDLATTLRAHETILANGGIASDGISSLSDSVDEEYTEDIENFVMSASEEELKAASDEIIEAIESAEEDIQIATTTLQIIESGVHDIDEFTELVDSKDEVEVQQKVDGVR